jgi:hypothetical protein
MATKPRVDNIRQVTPYFGHLPGGTETPAGSIMLTGVADPGVTLTLTDVLSSSAVLSSNTSQSNGSWFLDLSFFAGSPLAPGLHNLIVTAYPTGYPGPAGTSSDGVVVLVGTTGNDALSGKVLSTGITGPSYVFAGPGDDTVIAYSIVPDGAGQHASGTTVIVDGGRERMGDGLDTVLLPVSLSGLEAYERHTGDDGTPNVVLHTVDATVTLRQVERIGFAGVTLTVQSDPLVDFLYYDARYPDIAAADLNVRAHYDAAGWHEGRDPNALFSTQGYLSAYGDVRGAGYNPLSHFDTTGWKEGRDPSAAFDTKLYLTFNPDVAKSGMDPLVHYLNFGIEEGRKSSPVVESTQVKGGFDPLYYKLANADVGLSGLDARVHYDQFGWKEGRNPDAFFDTNWYLAHNADVKAAGIDPLAHYEAFGWKEGRDPSTHFDTHAYLAVNADVAASGMSPLQHFLQFGAAEGRSGFGDLY